MVSGLLALLDVWKERIKLLTPYLVNLALMKAAGNPQVKFMHCLPSTTLKQ